ncbi:hypothetical protein [Flavobacterium faecale]|uniref:hypothetical protein n=1 Tax=Flavobacterium faecale TaxID=1355330 RepID=UPI003AADB819
MRAYLVFIILFLNSYIEVIACGYSPYGEDVRYCLLKPEYFNSSIYQSFNYNANLWGFAIENNSTQERIYIEANIIDWFHFTKKRVKISAIEEFNNNLNLSDINPNSNNEFIKYLYKKNEKKAITYLKMAKNCEAINNFINEDYWERNENNYINERLSLLEKLTKIISLEKNSYFKRKYAFLAIRLAYYSGKKELIKEIFETHFVDTRKDYLYNWSLFFYTFTNWDGKAMVSVANLMSNCPEKTKASYYYFHENFNVDEALKHTTNPLEISNIYAYASVQKADKNLNYLKLIFAHNPKSSLLDFLLLREVNKIEDWVYTPFYTNYSPSTESYFWNETEKTTTETLRNRSENDRQYAKEVLAFISSIDYNKTKNPILWQACEINLQFISRQYDACINNIDSFEKKYANEKVIEEIEKIKALCITANQESNHAIIKPELEPIILKYKNDQRFIFALGRELEFKGNITDGIALISLSERIYPQQFDYDDVEWRANRIKTSGNLEVLHNYFDYLDFVYPANELQIIINRIKRGDLSEFQKNIYQSILKDRETLTDLLGTKYIRENQLTKAYITFKSLGDKYWDENYNPWERGKNSYYEGFDQNPFYDFKYTKNFIKHKEKFIVTKLSITKQLIKYKNLANNLKTKDRDYYYFLLGNCYYNMSDYGNSWLMRRYFNSSSYWDEYINESYIDEIEFRNKIKAVTYYRLAFQNAKTPKFKALCLRMMDYAEKHTFSFSQRVNKSFPKYSSELSGCENLKKFFESRR